MKVTVFVCVCVSFCFLPYTGLRCIRVFFKREKRQREGGSLAFSSLKERLLLFAVSLKRSGWGSHEKERKIERESMVVMELGQVLVKVSESCGFDSWCEKKEKKKKR